MKIVINVCFGGFGLTEEAKKALGIEYSEDIKRTDSRLVEMVETDAVNIADRFAELEVIEIPDEATDWEINEYDGLESITYVVDGKLYHEE
jgi:hypothetical protein